MRFSRAVSDLRFVIGSFLAVIGFIVLVQYFIHPDELAQDIPVNLLGSAMLILTGLSLGGSVLLERADTP